MVLSYGKRVKMSPFIKEVMVTSGVVILALAGIVIGILAVTAIFVALSMISQVIAGVFSILLVVVLFSVFLTGLMRMFDGD